jgi:hypothetical protein
VVICVSMHGFAECVLLLQMVHVEEVEDLGDLHSTLPDSTLPEASTVELAPPSDASEGPSATPAPTGASEDHAPAPALTGEDSSKTVGEPAAEDPLAAARPLQVAG